MISGLTWLGLELDDLRIDIARAGYLRIDMARARAG